MFLSARVNPVDPEKVAHPFQGDQRKPGIMPRPDYLEISPNLPGSGVIMAGYTDDERFSGDTWHSTLKDAKELALKWFGVPVDAWAEIPEPKPRTPGSG